MLKKLKEEEFLISVSDISLIQPNSYIYREGNGKVQIAKFIGFADDGGMILENVIDVKNNEFFVDEGILYPSKKDYIYIFDSTYNNDIYSIQALKVIQKWALLSKHSKIKKDIVNFICAIFCPRYVLFLKECNLLNYIFIPVQQKFKIGRFAAKFKWESLNKDNFKTKLETLIKDEYITYMGYLPQGIIDKPMFYTTGNETHLETDSKLKKEPFLYSSNCGGNIKLLDEKSKKFLVDAGSSYKGNGVNSSLEEALIISKQLKSIYPEYIFIPTNGRGALGTQCSF